TTIRELIFNESTESQYALSFLSKSLPDKEVEEIVKGLSEKEKEVWKSSVVRDGFNVEDIARFVRTKLTAAIVDSKPVLDNEIMEIIFKMKPSDVMAFCSSYRKEGAALLNVLQTSFLGDMIADLPAEKSLELME